MIRTRIAATLLIALLPLGASSLFTSAAFAQRYSGDSRNYFDYGEQFYSRVVESADGMRVTARFSMASAMFSFLRCDKPQQIAKGEYYAIRDVYVEITQRGNPQTVASKNVIDTIYAQNFDQTTSKTLWHAMQLPLTLPTADLDTSRPLTLRAEVRDGILARLAVRPMSKQLHLRPFDFGATSVTDSTAIGLSDVTLYDRVDPTGDHADITAKGTTYPFSRDINGAFQIAVPAGAHEALGSLSGECVLTQLSTVLDPDDTTPVERARVRFDPTRIKEGMVYRLVETDSMLHFVLSKPDSAALGRDPGRSAVADARAVATLPFVLPGKKLEQGRYRLTITVVINGVQRHLTNEFTLIWPNMPISLDDPRDAINPLVHITTESDFKDLQSGSRAELTRKLYRFWKQQDPTPETAFNERMAAFYARVDYAYFNFATSHSLDGATTERGKIYILFGPPSKIERELLPGQPPVETWTYTNNVHRQFRFVDTSGRGDYKLVEMKNL